MIRPRRSVWRTVHLLIIAALVIWLGSLSLPFPAKFMLLLLTTLLIPAAPFRSKA